MATTDQLLNAVLVTQVEILGRLERIEKALEIEQPVQDKLLGRLQGRASKVPEGVDAMAALQSLMESDHADAYKGAVDDLIDTISR